MADSKLEAIVIGNSAAALQGVPITTQDIDLFVRDTKVNQEKIKSLVVALGPGVVASRPFEPSSKMIRIEGLAFDIDIVFELSSRVKFESLRSRASEIPIGSGKLKVADLSDVVAAKKAANRPKDVASLPILEHALEVRREMKDDETNG
ncbi:MAG: hypothetical protein RH917_14750 [Lacipirellulaceae bacterium]